MTDADFPSGPWTGFYQEDGANCPMDLDLTFDEGRVSGAGADEIGQFSIRGSFDPATKEVWWTKRYASHDVHYKGYREVRGIWGLWSIHEIGSGFHIWPLGQGESASASRSVEAEIDDAISQLMALPLPGLDLQQL